MSKLHHYSWRIWASPADLNMSEIVLYKFNRQVRLDHPPCLPSLASPLSQGCFPQQCPPCPCRAYPCPCPLSCPLCQAWQRPCSRPCLAWCRSIPDPLQLAECLPQRTVDEIEVLQRQEVLVLTHMIEDIEDQATGTQVQLQGANVGWVQEDRAQLEVNAGTEIVGNIRIIETGTEIIGTTAAMAGIHHQIGISLKLSWRIVGSLKDLAL